MKDGPIILVDDDAEDKEILQQVLLDLQVSNPLNWFCNCETAMQYLRTTSEQPFLIICDVNLPKQSGLEFKKELDADEGLRRKSIPFIFCSTSVNQDTVNSAYRQMTVQGFFQKCFSYDEFRENIRIILEYWGKCSHPTSV